MTRAARCGVVLLTVLATLGARPPVVPRAEVPVLPPSLVLQRYEEALAQVKAPPAVIFEYAVEQSGTRNIEQTHRVYRSGGRERDETLRVDGMPLKPPQVRVFETPNRYDVAKLAPKPGDYTFAFSRTTALAGRPIYTFRTEIQKLAAFAITEVDIDGEHFLPRALHFTTVNGAIKGKGRVTYAPAGTYWLPREASVEARLSNGKTARERITWAGFRFPERLPSSTFSQPHAHESEPPATPAP